VAAAQRWRLDLAYDGATFHGFADQPGQPTVVGELRAALARTLRLVEPPLVTGAGRTDAGVHAFAQVVHVDLPEPLYGDSRGEPVERLVRSVNRQLAGRVVVLAARRVGADFHARFSATWRAYRYLVVESDEPPLELTGRLAWTVPGPLDLELMNEAVAAAVGTHDFRSFCRRPAGAPAETPLRREVLEARWRPLEDTWSLTPWRAPVYRLDIRANAFCHQMVRSLTAAAVAVGRGAAPVSLVADRLSTPSRVGLPPPAPPGGLSLIGVGYPELAGGPSGFVS
jgi:tRNA pseudouridine38-40 synthase